MGLVKRERIGDDSGTIRCLHRVLWGGPALPVTRMARCCHWTLSRGKAQS
jgi:hypothetical protein